MNAEEKIQHIKDLAKARAKKYYEKNKEIILQKRKEEREQLNKTIQEIKEKQNVRLEKEFGVIKFHRKTLLL